MPNKCEVLNCRGNYNKENRHRTVSSICLLHVCLLQNLHLVEDQQLRYFLQKDKITSYDAFKPERNMQKQHKSLIISRSKERLVCLFMTDNFSECSLSVIVKNKPTLCSPLMLSAFKNGISVPLFKTLHPNNGLRSYTQLDETVRLAMHYDIPFDKTTQNVVTLLQAHTSAYVGTEKEKKLVFLTRQLELFLQKQFFHNNDNSHTHNNDNSHTHNNDNSHTHNNDNSHSHTKNVMSSSMTKHSPKHL
ncbi:hypothetical protein FHG87_019477 [Trinorchestia longiramus]|nr:hypothetical protein FHG87_019477 [Trinorchestia longiramus]